MSKTRSELIRMIALNQAFNPMDLTSRPTTKQDEVLRDVWSRHKYVIAGNQSGKSQTKARDVAWKLTETHPYWSCLLYTSPSPRDQRGSRMPSSA